MAQDFVRYTTQATNSATPIFTASSNDAVIGIRVTNTTAGAITIDVFVTITGPTNRYIAKGLSIPPSSSVELVTGGAKFVMQNTDVLNVESDTATSADVYVSVVESISAQITNMDSLYTTTYIGNKPGAQDVYTHAQVLENQNVVIESAVLAGPVTIVNAFTVTGTLVIL